MIKKTIFTTSNGIGFDSQVDAEKQERFITAKSEFEGKKESFKRIIAETMKTADGEDFALTRSHSFYYVHESFEPRIEEIDIWVWHVDFDIDERNDSKITLYEKKDGREFNQCLIRRLEPEYLYRHKQNAVLKLIGLKEAKLKRDEQEICSLYESIRVRRNKHTGEK